MGTLTAYIKKEVLESARQYRYLVLGIGIFIFAILDPVMLKLLPDIMKGQLPQGVDLSQMFVVTQRSALQNYVKDLFQIGSLFIALSLMGLISDEVTLKRLVFPYSKGSNVWGITLSKMLHYSIVIAIFVIIGFAINFYYAATLFKEDAVTYSNVFVSSVLVAVYYCFTVSMILLFSSLFKKSIAAGICTLVVSYLMPLTLNIKGIEDYIPYKLVSEANKFAGFDRSILTTISAVIIYIIIFNTAAILKMKKTEIK